MSAAEVLDRTQIEWAALQDLVSRLSDDELSAAGPEGWAVKDHLAHVAEWERGCTAVLAHRSQWEAFGLAASDHVPDIDSLNDILYRRHRDESVAEVKAFANASHAEMLAALSQVSDEDLRRRVGEYGMQSNPDRTLLEKIAGDTYEHYEEHRGYIQALLA